MNMYSSSFSPSELLGGDILDDSYLDGCSICLEPFTSLDPPSVTKCKHEYHLHCIIEWSQRRVECPVCLQHLVLNDPTSQEVLAAVEREKNLRSRQKCDPVSRGNESSSLVNGSDNELSIMRRFAAIANRARSITRTRTQMTQAVSPPQTLMNMSNVTQSNSSSLEHRNLASCVSDINSASSVGATTLTPANMQHPINSSSSELAAFSESLKSKISTASIRCKESISKNTHSLKEKLIAHNDSVKELSRGVRREMSAGITGIARIITPKRSGVSVPSSSCAMGTTNYQQEAIGMEDEAVQSVWPSKAQIEP